MPSFSVVKGIMEDGAKRCNLISLDHSLHLLGKNFRRHLQLQKLHSLLNVLELSLESLDKRNIFSRTLIVSNKPLQGVNQVSNDGRRGHVHVNNGNDNKNEWKTRICRNLVCKSGKIIFIYIECSKRNSRL
ncbi:hypothetical protein EGR_08250 [Echinococcus granulosus]|uniref:Uncharacterized protein n=1 Tax=Echinococcus granulosus TaxID=6210 RepID=W6U6N6_ECHGR|nr:hypothetical protein EGR_08250 [Echinococcus granulosus]EUB56898.1 hypothetical protein EGR_08250 [Echinococcus granulosus]